MDAQKRNLAARAGRWSANHRKTAIFGWLAFVVIAIVLGGAVGTQNQTDADLDIGESGRADAALRAHYPDGESETVLVQSKKLTVNDGEFHAAIADVEKRVGQQPGVRDVESPLRRRRRGLEGRALGARRVRDRRRRRSGRGRASTPPWPPPPPHSAPTPTCASSSSVAPAPRRR